MSREENKRYLQDVTQSQLRKVPVLGWLGRHPFRKLLLLWAVMLPVWYVFYAFLSNPSPLTGEGEWPVPSPQFPLELDRKWILVVILIVVSVVAGRVWRQVQLRKAQRRYAEALQHPTPEALLQLADELIPPTSAFPNADLFRAQSRAMARILYGQEDLARHELNRVTWQGKAPLLQAMERGSDALIHLLCKDAPERGLTLAREALSLADLNPSTPGAKTSRAFYDVLLHSSEFLTGKGTPEGMRLLRQHHEAFPFMAVRLISAWTLRAAALQGKDAEGAERMRQFLQTHAPHCVALHRLPARATAEA